MSRWNSEDGFTLVEIAIVLVLVGLLLSMGSSLIGPMTRRIKYIEAKEATGAAIESVIGFGSTNNRIPTAGEFSGIVRTSIDPWRNNLYYIPSSNLIVANAKIICGRSSTDITVNLCGSDSTCSSPAVIPNVAFVIISGGGNFNIQTDNVANVVNVYDPDIAGIDDYTTDMTRAETYDDMVKWLPLNELRMKIGCSGPQMRVVNSDLPSGSNAAAYSSEVFADGGVPFSSGGDYRWCIQTVTGTVDASFTITPNLTPVNTDCQSVAEGLWAQGNSLTITAAAPSAGTHSMTIFVRDDNDQTGSSDNSAQRLFTINIS